MSYWEARILKFTNDSLYTLQQSLLTLSSQQINSQRVPSLNSQLHGTAVEIRIVEKFKGKFFLLAMIDLMEDSTISKIILLTSFYSSQGSFLKNTSFITSQIRHHQIQHISLTKIRLQTKRSPTNVRSICMTHFVEQLSTFLSRKCNKLMVFTRFILTSN